MAQARPGTIRWALIGCGEIADKRVAPAISSHPDCELTLVMCRDTDRAGYFAEKHGAVWSTTRPETLFSDPDIDAVYIATPPSSHCEYALAAACEGKHVLCEKPMALSGEECDRMIAACREHGVTLGVAYYRRLYPQIAALRRMLAAGELGRPALLHARVAGPRPARADDWRLDPAHSAGGPLPDIGSHRLDLFAYLFGPPERVGAALETPDPEAAVEETATVFLRLPGPVRAVLVADWSGRELCDLFEIVGSEGRVLCDPLNGDSYRVEREGREETRQVEFPANVHAPLIADFVAAIREARAPICPGEEGATATRIIEAAYRSAREKRFV